MKQHIRNSIVFLIGAGIVYAILAFLIETKILNDFYVQVLMIIGINIILACSLNLVIGFTGQLALGHAL